MDNYKTIVVLVSLLTVMPGIFAVPEVISMGDGAPIVELQPDGIDAFIVSSEGVVTMDFFPSAYDYAAVIVSGLLPNTTYNLYDGDFHHHAEVVSDESGNYVFNVTLDVPHFIVFSARKSTLFITDDATGGNCTTIGTWNSVSRTCTLTANLINETIQIDSNNMVLDCNGFSIIGYDMTGFGGYSIPMAIYLPIRSGVTV